MPSRFTCVMSCLTACVAFVAAAIAAEPVAEPISPPGRTGAGQGAAPAADDLGYVLGYRIGRQIRADNASLGVDIDSAALARGLADGVQEAQPKLDEATFKRVLAAFEQQMQDREKRMQERMVAAAKLNLAKGADFLKANATRKGVTTLPSGLQYEVLAAGTGPKPKLDDVVVAHYKGSHVDGKEFDGTDPAGDPASFPLRGVVPGWQEALPLMAVGSKWRIYLPPDLGYGEGGSPPAIEPNEVLVFDIELVGIRPPAQR
jgi:FKBP-type peptidyl-prolyl cis-trans isomerase